MADLKANIRQAISDFDDIKAALEENGVPVPYDTNTSEYGNLVRKLGTEVSHEIIGYVDEELAKKVDKAEGERLIILELISKNKKIKVTDLYMDDAENLGIRGVYVKR